MHYKMRNRKTLITALIGLTLAIIGTSVNLTIRPYQNLKFPLDIISIEMIVIGISLLLSIIINVIKNKNFEKVILLLLPVLIVLKYGIDLLFATEIGNETHDLLLAVFRYTYPISIVTLLAQIINVAMTNKIMTIISSIIGILWTIISIIEMAIFLDFRLGAAEYAKEPNNIRSFVLIMVLITFWTMLKIFDLKRLKITHGNTGLVSGGLLQDEL